MGAVDMDLIRKDVKIQSLFSMTQIIRKQVINPILLTLHLKLLSLNRRSIGMKMAAGHTDASLLLK